jgi:hypothetical protein
VVFFKKSKSWMDATGQQSASGFFLVLMYPQGRLEGEPLFDKNKIRGMPIYTKMTQMGPWMMGQASIKGHKFTLSGSYGGDGLTCDVPRVLWELATPCPPELIEEWTEGGGHNSAGSEAPAMRMWAKELLDDIYSDLGWWRQKYARFL